MSPVYIVVTHMLLGPEQAPNPAYFFKWNVETPYRSHWDGQPQGWLTVMREQDRGKSEGRFVMKRIRVATLPYAKAG